MGGPVSGMDVAVKQVRKGLRGRVLATLQAHRYDAPLGQHGGDWCSCGWQAKRYSGLDAHDRHLAKQIVRALFGSRSGSPADVVTSLALPHTMSA